MPHDPPRLQRPDTHRCYDPADRVRARQAAADAEAARRQEVAAVALAAARAEVRKHAHQEAPTEETQP